MEREAGEDPAWGLHRAEEMVEEGVDWGGDQHPRSPRPTRGCVAAATRKCHNSAGGSLRACGDSSAGLRPAARDGAFVAAASTIGDRSRWLPLLGRAALARPRASAGLSPQALRG